jgi:conjugal transfer pilus assembly protein TraU
LNRIKSIFVCLVLTLATLSINAETTSTTTTSPASGTLCPNKFPDFINDICWSCMFPFKIFGAKIMQASGEDFNTDADGLVCVCPEQLKVGAPVSFWEMSYIVDVHTAPGCLPTLGGLTLPVPWVDNQYGVIGDAADQRRNAFRNSAYYVSPMMYLLELVLDDACSDRSPFDVGWASEFDPTWADDELALIKMPVSFAFGTLPGIMAAGPDSAAALVGFPINSIFWQAGSLGPMYPLTGNVRDYKSMDQVGSLLATRMLAEAHAMREMVGLFAKGGGRSYACESGEPGCDSSVTKGAMCAGSPSSFPQQLIMPKKQYKLQRIFPNPATTKLPLGGCCQPIGRTTTLTEKGTQLPLDGYKDFGYAIFRKRDCCSGVVSPVTFQ